MFPIYFHEKIISLTLQLMYSMAITLFLDQSHSFLHPQISSCSCKLTLNYFFHSIRVHCGCFQMCPQLSGVLISVAAQFLSPEYVTIFNDLWIANEVLSDYLLLTCQGSQCLRPKGMAKLSLPLASMQMVTGCADCIHQGFLLPDIHSLRLLPYTENPQKRLANLPPCSVLNRKFISLIQKYWDLELLVVVSIRAHDLRFSIHVSVCLSFFIPLSPQSGQSQSQTDWGSYFSHSCHKSQSVQLWL